MTRTLLGALAAALLVPAAAARADVLVPADPPVAATGCVAGARDLLAVGRAEHVVEVSSGGGPARRIRGLELCPVVAAAADGTAAVASSSGSRPARIAVRLPGGDFGSTVL